MTRAVRDDSWPRLAGSSAGPYGDLEDLARLAAPPGRRCLLRMTSTRCCHCTLSGSKGKRTSLGAFRRDSLDLGLGMRHLVWGVPNSRL